MHWDSAQQALINHRNGHAVGLAGAGAGKTACITERTAKRIEEDGIRPRRILALTFTNKAAGEMRERVTMRLKDNLATSPWLIDGEMELPNVTTFHKFGHQLMIRGRSACYRTTRASLMDEKEPLKLLRGFMSAKGFGKADETQWLLGHNFIRSEGFVPGDPRQRDEIMGSLEMHVPDLSVRERDLALQGFIDYEAYKEEYNLLDFDDLICLPIRGLQENPKWRERIQSWYRDVTVDEAQDNNLAQYKLVRLVASDTLIMVGDDDQSIHRWRGARPDILQKFIREFNATEYRLEANYRSTPQIVDSATQLIRNNTDRLEKNPYATRNKGSTPVTLNVYDNGGDMTNLIAKQIAEGIKAGKSPADFAILYRVNSLAKSFEPALIRLGIPYQIKAGTDLMSRTEIKMLISAARLAVNKLDLQAFDRLAQILPGVGSRALEAIVDSNDTVGMGILGFGETLSGKAGKSMSILNKELSDLYERGPKALVGWARKSAFFASWLEKESARQVQQRLKSTGENAGMEESEVQGRIEEAINSRYANLNLIQESILSRAAADTTADDAWATAMDLLLQPPDDAGRESVMLCTVHGSKGLQWDTVHVAGFSDGLIPYRRETIDGDGISAADKLTEERCLAYVALTRAQNNCQLHHAKSLDLGIGRGLQRFGMSPYLAELGDAHQDSNIKVINHGARERKSFLRQNGNMNNVHASTSGGRIIGHGAQRVGSSTSSKELTP